MKTHINDNELELLFLDDSNLTKDQTNNIRAHLTECELCTEKYTRIKSFYSYIENNIAETEENDSDIALKLKKQNTLAENEKLLNEGKRAITIYNGSYEIIEQSRKSLLKWMGEFVLYNPIKVTGSLVFIGILIIVLFNVKKTEKEFVNPSLAIIENNVLSVYNEMGDVLWKRGVPGMSDYRTDISFDNQKDKSNTRELLLDDLNHDGINELLLTGNYSMKGVFARDTIYCFNNVGELKWKYGCGKLAKFSAPRWKFNFLFISDFFTFHDNLKHKERLFVIAGSNYSPTKFFELEISTGKVVQEFYNTGGITATSIFDINGDKKEEIIVGGINDAFDCAFIAVFNPNSVSGFSASNELYIPKAEQKNTASKYVLIPHTNYGKLVSNSDYNIVSKFLTSREDETITAYVQEVPAPGHQLNVTASILYNFGKDLKLNSIVPGDDFMAHYSRLYKAGKLKIPLNADYIEKLAKKVTYLK